MTSGDAAIARAHLSGMGQAERLSLLPLSPVDVTDEVPLARIALATGDDELAAAARASADGRASLNPGVASIAGTAAHVRGLIDDDLAELGAAIKHFERGPRPIALASSLEDGGVALLSTRRSRRGRRESWTRPRALRRKSRIPGRNPRPGTAARARRPSAAGLAQAPRDWLGGAY